MDIRRTSCWVLLTVACLVDGILFGYIIHETDPWLFMLEGQLLSIVALMACICRRLFEQYFRDVEAEGLKAYVAAQRFIDSGHTTVLGSKNRDHILLTLARKDEAISIVRREWSIDRPSTVRRCVYLLTPDGIRKSIVIPRNLYVPQYHPEFTPSPPLLRLADMETPELKSLLQLLGELSPQPIAA